MSGHSNDLGQPIGFPVPEWEPCLSPSREAIDGRYCRLEPIDAEQHAEPLFAADNLDETGSRWTYLPYGPFDRFEDYRAWVEAMMTTDSRLFFAIVDRERGGPTGVASYLRIDEQMGSIEVGGINYSPLLAQTRAATEAMYLMMAHVFDDLGYRRYEWKCDSLNAPSRAAAKRLGFTYEGQFRQVVMYKGRNRDTDWFSIIDADWPVLKASFERWLDPSNFDGDGQQLSSLHEGLAVRAS
ncbi:MAG: GNAT family protein [Chloroflexi bacterium]|nr:GNAT family protein [Chloroflexota bacterium]MDA1147194.1 GNAT family protein [Chloroflexota bacterium]